MTRRLLVTLIGACILTSPIPTAFAALTETISPMLSTTLTAVLRDQQSGQYEYARARLLQFLQQYPHHPVATAALADLYMRQVQLYQLSHMRLKVDTGERAKIYAELKQAHDRYPDHPRLLAAWERWHRLFETAPSVYEQPWQDSYQPKNLPAYLKWGKAQLDDRNLFAAKQIGMVALELGPTHPESYLLMGELLAASDHLTEAERFAQQAELLGIEKMGQGDRLLALKRTLQEAQLDMSEAVASTHTPTQHVINLLEPLTTKKLAVSMEELHSLLPQAHQLQDITTLWEAVTAAGIHAQRSGKSLNPALLKQYQQELAQLQASTPSDRLALSLARLNELMNQPTHYAALAQNADDRVAGLALFQLGDYTKANERLDAIDGVAAEGYQQVADILMLHHAFVMADTMARRGLQMGDLPSLHLTLQAIEQQRELSRKALRYGDVDMQRKDWASATRQYQQAMRLNPESEAPYLRLGELLLKRKDPAGAYAEYTKAVKVSPSLLSSPTFSKKYQKLASKGKVRS